MQQPVAGAVPIIAVAGTVGKTTVAFWLDHALRTLGKRTVLWLDSGVSIDGHLQAGELQPWSRGMQMVLRGELDLAIQELPSPTILTVGLPRGTYQAAIVTNLARSAGNAALGQIGQDQSAANQVIAASVHPDGFTILNADDLEVADLAGASAARSIFWALRRRNPVLLRHLSRGGAGVYLSDDTLVFEQGSEVHRIARLAELPVMGDGQAAFQISNLLAVAAGCVAVGLFPSQIGAALQALPEPSQFIDRVIKLENGAQCRVIIARTDRLLAVRAIGRFMRRIAAGGAPVIGAVIVSPTMYGEDLAAWGRSLAQIARFLFFGGRDAAGLADATSTATATVPPPICLAVGSEMEAITRLLRMASSGDIIFVLTDDVSRTTALVESFEVSTAAAEP